MQRFFKTGAIPQPALVRLLSLAALALAWLLPATARSDVALYEGVVPLKGLTEADRTAGFGDALRVAAVRASGRAEAATNPVIAAAAAKPAPYVQQYSTTPDRMLKVGFDGRGVEQLLQQAGLPLWPAERPTTLVLLYVPEIAGASRAVLGSERPPERVELEREALARGVPLTWPAQPVDRAQASSPPADGVNGAAAALLVGVGGGAQFSWTFSHAGQSAHGDGSPKSGLDLAADALAARYAPPSTRGVSTESVKVGGVIDLRAYAALLEYLQSLSLVRGMSVEEVAGQSVRVKLSLRGDLELLRRIAALDGRLRSGAVASGQDAATGTDFTWQP